MQRISHQDLTRLVNKQNVQIRKLERTVENYTLHMSQTKVALDRLYANNAQAEADFERDRQDLLQGRTLVQVDRDISVEERLAKLELKIRGQDLILDELKQRCGKAEKILSDTNETVDHLERDVDKLKP